MTAIRTLPWLPCMLALVAENAGAQAWQRDDFERLAGVRAAWSMTSVADDGTTRELRMRLWLADSTHWALLVDLVGAMPETVLGFEDCGVRDGIYWEMSPELLRHRPAGSRRIGLRATDRDPALAGALLQVGHFMWQGGHLATVLGGDAGRDADGNLVTEAGCVIARSAERLRIVRNPSVAEQSGVTYEYGEADTTATFHRPLHRRVVVFVPPRFTPTYVLQLTEIAPVEAADVPFPAWHGDRPDDGAPPYPRRRDSLRQFLDTTRSPAADWRRDAAGAWVAAPVEKSWRHYTCLSVLFAISCLAWLRKK